MKFRTILLFGAPGAGKGTQGKILGRIPRFFHCACGDIFRSLNHHTELGRIFLDYSSRGQLVPDLPTVRLWHQFIHDQIRDGRFRPEEDTLVLDGIPRSASQAELLKETLEVVGVFYLKCEKEEALIQRLQRRALKENRLDDADAEVIRARLQTYEHESKPVLEFYDPKIVFRINADPAPVVVLRDIVDQLVKL